MQNMLKTEFYKKLDEVLPGGVYEQAKKDINRRIYFTRLSIEFLEEMHEYSLDERLYEYFEYEAFKKINETRQYLEKLINLEGNKIDGRTTICWFVRRFKDDKMIGTAKLSNIHFSRQSVEWGYGIDPKLWGLGYILDIQQILKEYVFETLKLNRLWGGTRIDNQRTRSSLLLAGVKEEGILRQSLCDSDGVYHDVWCYSIIAEDYFADKNIKRIPPISKLVTKEMVAKIVGQALGHPKVDIKDDMDSVLKWDSLSHISVILAIEKVVGFPLHLKKLQNQILLRIFIIL